MSTTATTSELNLFPNAAVTAAQTLTVDATAGGVQFGTTFHAATTHVLIDSESADIRYTIDATAPTATVGHRKFDGASWLWNVVTANAAKFIRTASTSATVTVSELVFKG